MSLLLLNASNRLAQGFLKVAVESGQYERIVCADIFPCYTAINRLLKFRHSLNTTAKIDLFKINDKQDLHDVIKQCNNLLYVTHDYYLLTASKKNLLIATIDQVKRRNYKTVAYVAPVEHDHQGEIDEWKHLEVEGKRSIPQLTEIRADITFGPSSSFTNYIANRIYQGQNIYYRPSGNIPHPIFTGDLDKIIGEVLKGQHEGRQFLAQGHKHIDFKSIFHLLEGSLGLNYKANFNKSLLENIISPTSINLISQSLYCPNYQNTMRLINNFKHLDNRGYDKLPLDTLVDIEEYYKNNQTIPESTGGDLVSHIVG